MVPNDTAVRSSRFALSKPESESKGGVGGLMQGRHRREWNVTDWRCEIE